MRPGIKDIIIICDNNIHIIRNIQTEFKWTDRMLFRITFDDIPSHQFLMFENIFSRSLEAIKEAFRVDALFRITFSFIKEADGILRRDFKCLCF